MASDPGLREVIGPETDEQTPEGCPECNGDVVTEGRERVCQDCGAVVGADDLDRGPEWYATDLDGEAVRCRGGLSTITHHNRNLGSEVGRGGSPSENAQMARLRREHKRATAGDKKDRGRRYLLGEVSRIADALDLPAACRGRASKIVREHHDHQDLHGRDLDSVAAAAVQAASREMCLGVDVPAVAEVARAPPKRIRNEVKRARRDLGLELPPIEPHDVLARILDEFEDVPVDETELREALDKLVDRGYHSGFHPAGVVAGAIYALAGPGLTQAEVQDAAGVSRVTIRKRYQEIEEVLGIDE